jgi:hypothetical protein
LGAIAAIRTVLNYFLEKDIKEFEESEPGGNDPRFVTKVKNTTHGRDCRNPIFLGLV